MTRSHTCRFVLPMLIRGFICRKMTDVKPTEKSHRWKPGTPHSLTPSHRLPSPIPPANLPPTYSVSLPAEILLLLLVTLKHIEPVLMINVSHANQQKGHMVHFSYYPQSPQFPKPEWILRWISAWWNAAEMLHNGNLKGTREETS